MTSGPSLCLCVERENAVKKLLELVGPEDPLDARKHSQFFWRGVFGVDAVKNAIYCKLFIHSYTSLFDMTNRNCKADSKPSVTENHRSIILMYAHIILIEDDDQ